MASDDAPRQEATHRPPLILVGGSPASGKSSLAEVLARELRLPLLRKDRFKETLADALDEAGVPLAGSELAVSRQVGLTAIRLLYRVAHDIVDAGAGCIVESNFHRGLSEDDLRPLVERSDARLIHCEAAREIIVARFQARAEAGERHPVHVDADQVEDLNAKLDAGEFAPLDLAVPTLRVDTADGYHPSISEMVRWLQQTQGDRADR